MLTILVVTVGILYTGLMFFPIIRAIKVGESIIAEVVIIALVWGFIYTFFMR
jgi:hypothetical protein